MQDYLACVKAVEERVGRLMDCFEQENLADHTLVVSSLIMAFSRERGSI
jgi:arylsulfatase A-like enzyme